MPRLNHYHYLVMRTLTPLVLLSISFRYRWRLRAKAAKAERANDVKTARAKQDLADQATAYAAGA